MDLPGLVTGYRSKCAPPPLGICRDDPAAAVSGVQPVPGHGADFSGGTIFSLPNTKEQEGN